MSEEKKCACSETKDENSSCEVGQSCCSCPLTNKWVMLLIAAIILGIILFSK